LVIVGFGPEDPHTAAALANLGDLYKLMGRSADSRRLMGQAEDLLRAAYGEVHPFMAYIKHSMATVCIREGNYDEGLTYYREALRMQRNMLGATHPETAQTLFALASAEYAAATTTTTTTTTEVTTTISTDEDRPYHMKKGDPEVGKEMEKKGDRQTRLKATALANFRLSFNIIMDQGMDKWPIGLRALEHMARCFCREGEVETALRMTEVVRDVVLGGYDTHVHLSACRALAAQCRSLAAMASWTDTTRSPPWSAHTTNRTLTSTSTSTSPVLPPDGIATRRVLGDRAAHYLLEAIDKTSTHFGEKDVLVLQLEAAYIFTSAYATSEDVRAQGRRWAGEREARARREAQSAVRMAQKWENTSNMKRFRYRLNAARALLHEAISVMARAQLVRRNVDKEVVVGGASTAREVATTTRSDPRGTDTVPGGGVTTRRAKMGAAGAGAGAGADEDEDEDGNEFMALTARAEALCEEAHAWAAIDAALDEAVGSNSNPNPNLNLNPQPHPNPNPNLNGAIASAARLATWSGQMRKQAGTIREKCLRTLEGCLRAQIHDDTSRNDEAIRIRYEDVQRRIRALT
jgi:hypothetical protein